MKKITTIASLLITTSAMSFGQSVVAGWDFSQFAFDGFSSTDGATLTGQISANYIGTQGNYTGAAAIGTIYYDGSFGSTALGLNPSDVEPTGFGDMTVANRGFLGEAGERARLGTQGQTYTSGRALGFNSGANGDSFVIEMDLGALFGSDWLFTFGAKTNSDPNNSSSIAWEYSLNGADYTSAGVTSAITNNASEFTVDLTGVSALNNQSTAYFRGTFSGIDGGITFIDNIGFELTTSAVPEPSTFAAIFGCVALAFAGVRRRR